jgi:DNA polymerase-4
MPWDVSRAQLEAPPPNCGRGPHPRRRVVTRPAGGRWGNPILHADLDAFYANVEILRNPALRGKPVIVGGTSSRGVVTSASYEARRYGVRSAMPTSRARRICPGAVFIQPDFDAYIEKSKRVREVLDSFSMSVEPLSLDEAFLDVSRAWRIWPDPESVAEALKDQVLRRTGLVISVGVAPNKFLAKMASKHAKPDGLLVVAAGGVQSFLNPLPVGDIWGVGEQTEAILGRLGLKTIGDVAAAPAGLLERALGSFGTQIAQLAAGRDDRQVVASARAKSVGSEETYEQDQLERTQTLAALLRLCDRVASRLRGQGISGRTVTLKVRLSNFATFNRSKTLSYEIDGASGIYGVAKELLADFMRLRNEELGRLKIRLLGASVSSLVPWPAAQQLKFGKGAEWAAADLAVDRVRNRFGPDSVGLGAFLQR